MRDRLIELLNQINFDYGEECVFAFEDGYKCAPDFAEFFADHLIKNGVIAPPVKVGQTVYSKKCNAYVVEGIHYKNGRFLFGGNRENQEGAPQSAWFEKDIGKTVFLTREEAEKALAEVANET